MATPPILDDDTHDSAPTGEIPPIDESYRVRSKMGQKPTPPKNPSKSSRRLPCWAWAIILPLAVLIIGTLVLAALPVEADEPIPESEWNVGTTTIEPSWTGLKREWQTVDAIENLNPAVAELGYRLFFDPIVSGENTFACATCHHPDRGFADGKVLGMGESGEELPRHVPSLWNAAYNAHYFWDGRVDTLEEQLVTPITAENEMNEDMDTLVDELSEIDYYNETFDALFDDGITAENIATALASFERTLISDGAAFDRYADGEFDALTSQQRRGLGIFRSAATRCFECHMTPRFNDDNFRIIGVPDNGSDDRGYGAIVGGTEMDYAFKIPTLRNAVLSAPYMHNGTFADLNEVVEFYAGGGGPGMEFYGNEENVDRHVKPGFTLSEQETEDLIAFMYALVDETLPERWWGQLDYIDETGHIIIPDEVPSGITDNLVQPEDNPAREVITEMVAEPETRPTCQRDAEAKTVMVIDTIQAAVDCAEAGDTVIVPPGVYHERVIIDISGITLRGIADGELPSACPMQKTGEQEGYPVFAEDEVNWAILDGDVDGDGEKDITDGIIASGNDFVMEYFIVRNYRSNGVLVEGVRGVTLRHIFTQNTGLYGVYPVRSDNVLVECNATELATDAGIYVGQSRGIEVRNNLAYNGVTGIEIENSVEAAVYENETWGNTGGILVFLLPNIHSRVSQDIQVYNNYSHHNNRGKDDATPGSVVGDVPIGTGLLVMASDNVEVYGNTFEGNDSFGVSLVSLYQAYEPEEINGVGPLQENNHIYNNTYIDNGNNAAEEVTDAGFSGADLIWDTRGYGNDIDEPNANVFPPIIPDEDTPPVIRRALFQVLNIIGKNL